MIERNLRTPEMNFEGGNQKRTIISKKQKGGK
jgi:hypothetical protein